MPVAVAWYTVSTAEGKIRFPKGRPSSAAPATFQGLPFMEHSPMQIVTKRGRRLYTVPAALSLTDRIAAKSNVAGNWAGILRMPKCSRVIINQHR